MAFSPIRRLTATAVLAALALPALAQQAPTQAPAAPATVTEGRTAPSAGEQRRDFKERRQAHRAQRLAALKQQLQLSPAQEPAWTAYTAALQPGERHARLDRKDLAGLSTPERIDRMRALRAQHSAEADRRGEATKAFYAALTPEQQKAFDARSTRQNRHGKHHGHGHHGERGEHGERHHQHRGASAPAAR